MHRHDGNRSPPRNKSIRAKRHFRSRTRSKTPMNGQKRCSRSCSPSQKCTKVKGGAERPSKSRSKSPDHDHITLREMFPIMHHDNVETPKTLNNRKNLSVPAKRHSRSRSKSRSRSRSTPKTPKKIVDASRNVDTSLETSIDTSQNLEESEMSTHRDDGNRSLPCNKSIRRKKTF